MAKDETMSDGLRVEVLVPTPAASDDDEMTSEPGAVPSFGFEAPRWVRERAQQRAHARARRAPA